jgi:hypothetical protein
MFGIDVPVMEHGQCRHSHCLSPVSSSNASTQVVHLLSRATLQQQCAPKHFIPVYGTQVRGVLCEARAFEAFVVNS